MGNNESTVSQADYARWHGVSRKTVSTWKQAGHLVMTSDGKIDVKASDAKLAERGAEYRGGVTKGPSGERGNSQRVTGNNSKVTGNNRQVTTQAAHAAERGATIRDLCQDDFSRGALWMAHEIVRQVGALGAVATVMAGGSCAVAYGVDKVLSVAMVTAAQDRLVQAKLGPFAAGPGDYPVWPDPSQCWEPNWPNLAADAGEPCQLEAWQTAFAKRDVAST